jgi:hypothetical protein
VGQLRAVVELPAVPLAPAAARAALAALLPVWGLSGLAEDARLLVSELVTDAVQHASRTDSLELDLLAHGARLRIALADGSAVRPVIRELTGDVPSGRGMVIIAQVAAAWGVEGYRGGKRVWVELVDHPADAHAL